MTDAIPPSPPEPTPDPTPEPSPQLPERSPQLSHLPKWVVIAGATIAVVAAGTAGVATYWVKTKLSPLVERSLTTLLDRPVEIGAVSGFDLTSVSFAASELPATASDRSFAKIPAVTAKFNPLQAIGGELDLAVTLEKPTVTLIQADSGRWLDIKLNRKPPEGFQVRLDTLAIEGGKVNLVPSLKPKPATATNASKQTQPGQPASGQAQPNPAQPNQAQPGQAQPNPAQPNQTQPGQAQPNPAQPNQTQLGQTSSGQAQPGQAQPSQATSNQTQPNQTASNSAQPQPTKPQTSNTNAKKAEVELVQAPNTVVLPAIETLPAPPTSLRLFDVDGTVTIEDDGKRVTFETIGKNGKFGRLDVQGEVQTASGAILLTVAAQNVASEALTTALPLPFELYGGRLFTNLKIALDANNLSEIPLMSGTARGTDVLMVLNGAPQPILIEKTNLAFKERQLALENAIGQYGPLPIKIDRGLIDLQRGYELPMLVPPVDWRVVRQAIVPDFAINGSGEIAAQLILRGPLQQPILIGQVKNQSPLEIDRVAVRDLEGRFGFSFGTGEFVLEQLNLTPASGGQIQAAVKVQLPKAQLPTAQLPTAQLPPNKKTSPQVLAEFVMQDINADAIAVDYGASLPIDRLNARGRVTLQNDTIGIAIPQIQIGDGFGQIIGQVRGDRWQGEIAVNNIAIDPAIAPTVSLGAFSGRAQVAGLTDVFSAPDLSKIALQGLGVTSVNGQPIQFGAQIGNGQWRVESQLQNVPIASFVNLPAPISRLDLGGLSGTAVATGITSGLQLIPTQIGGTGQVSVEGGTVAGTVSLNGDRWQSQVSVSNVGLAKLLPDNLPLNSPRLTSPRLNLAGTTAFDLATIVAQGAFAIGAENGRLQGTLAVRDAGWTVDLAQFALPVPDPWGDSFPLATSTAAPSRLSGSIFDFSPSAITGRIMAALPSRDRDPETGNPTGGVAVEFNLNRDRWQAGVVIPNQDLNALLSSEAIAQLTDTTIRPNIGGQIAANLAITGGWNGAMPTNINLEASGLQLKDLTLNGETISDKLVGRIVRGALSTTDGTTAFPLVAARYGDLPRFSAGEVADDFSIALIEPTDPNNPPADPNAIDRVIVQLSRDFMPRLFEAQLGELRAAGRCLTTDRCDVTTDRLPIAWFGLQPLPDRGRVEGYLGFSGQVNPTAGSLTGQIDWQEPKWGAMVADAIVGSVAWRDRQLGVNDLTVIRDETRYQFNGTVNLVDDPQIGLKMSVANGDLQDLLELLQWSEIEDISRGFAPPDLGTIADLNAVAVGDSTQSLLNSIRRLVEIDRLREQREQRTIGRAVLPDLRDLTGQFNAEVDLGGTVSNPLIEFAARGNDWQWQPYGIPEVQLVGRYRDRRLEFDPSWVSVRLDPNTPNVTRLDLKGILSPDLQSANLELTGLPLAFVGEVAKLPDQFRTSGLLDLSATLAGTQADPRLRGTLHLSDGRLNGKPIELEQGGFFYENGRIRFGGNVLTALATGQPAAVDLPEAPESQDTPETSETPETPELPETPESPDNTAVTIRGTSPWTFPGATNLDPDDRFSVTLATRDDGMAFLNALTSSVGWLGGRGEANITLDGRRQNGVYTVERTLGTATFDGAILQSPQLPEPLTDVHGTINLDGDRITVTDLIGRFQQGAVKATGTLSLFDPFAPNSLLTVVLDRVALNLKRIYSGGIDGRIEISGSALLPSIGGYLTLTDGLVFLPDPDAPTPASDPISSTPVIRYDDLKILLDNNIRLVSPPTLDFVAEGLLNVRGLLDNPSPAGKIFLRDGRVNLFTTAFTLDQSRFNTAIFDPQYGRDPILDVRMGAAVTQTTRNRIVSNVGAADVTRSRELQDFALERGGVETIRITATVQGRASQLFDQLELSSTPARPPLELYSLIGGGVSESTEGGGTVAIASSALLTQIQSIVSRALGLRDFRLFPAFDPRTSSLGLGAEVGIRLNDRLSTSFQVILDRDDSVRFGARYRISDDVILNGSTDFNGDDRGSIEFQTRF